MKPKREGAVPSMPKEKDGVRKTVPPEEITEIGAYVKGLTAENAAPGRPDTRCAPLATVFAEMARDVAQFPPNKQKDIRYINLSHLKALLSPEDLEKLKLAYAKLLNSLSWESSLMTPKFVEGEGLFLRLDLSELGWKQVGQWDQVEKEDAKAFRSVYEKALGYRELAAATGSASPVIPADWALKRLTRAPLYNALLQLPKTEAGLLQFMKGKGQSLDLQVERNSARVVRAFNNRSNVSSQNRMIERFNLPRGGYHWRSADFGNSVDKGKNLVRDILGLKPDGGEVIWSLPNGMQAYLLLDAAGNLIDVAPTAVVTDRLEPDAAVKNAASCFVCHAGGQINIRDQGSLVLGDRLKALQRDPKKNAVEIKAVEKELRSFPGQERVDQVIQDDTDRYQDRLSRIGIQKGADVLTPLIRRFDEDLTGKEMACSLDVDLGLLAAAAENNANAEAVRLQIETGCPVRRDFFEANIADLTKAFKAVELVGPALPPPSKATFDEVKRRLEAELDSKPRVDEVG